MTRIRRSTVQRAISMPSRLSCHHTFLAPYTWKFSSQTRQIPSDRAQFCRNCSGSRCGSASRALCPVAGGQGDRQHHTDRFDPVMIPVIVDVRDHLFSLWSSSAWVKKLMPSFRISLTRLSSPVLLLQGFEPLAFRRRRVLAQSLIMLGLSHPFAQRLRRKHGVAHLPSGHRDTDLNSGYYLQLGSLQGFHGAFAGFSRHLAYQPG